MFDDELEPRKPKKALLKLDSMSVNELEEYIVSLRDEIQRVELEITRKKSHMNAASSLFKSK